MKRRFSMVVLSLAAWFGYVTLASGGVRIKDITDLQGARINQLVGLGLVIGLDSTGGKSLFTQQFAVDMLQRWNVTAKTISEIRGDSVYKSGNISVVMVTADLGPFNRKGSKLDVLVSVLDDASSLQGGTLIFTPLKGADNSVYAVAQGPISVGGFSFGASGGGTGPAAGGGSGAAAQKNHPTVGRIAGGATIECEARGQIVRHGQIRLMLREPDPVTARAIAKVINQRYDDIAITVDAGTVQVFVPEEQAPKFVSFIGDLGLLEVKPDITARVVINERTGTIVAGEQVKIGTVALTHGNLAIVTSNTPIVSQPNPFGRGKTVVVQQPSVGVTEQKGSLHVIDKAVTVAELARALNALGATPRDLIIIFQALKQAGALHADLVVM
jgi:flagellar P-ring protein FlgI